MGDSARHRPFFGQGCTVASRTCVASPTTSIAPASPSAAWTRVRARRPSLPSASRNAAIADLAGQFRGMRDRVGDPKFILRKRGEALATRRGAARRGAARVAARWCNARRPPLRRRRGGARRTRQPSHSARCSPHSARVPPQWRRRSRRSSGTSTARVTRWCVVAGPACRRARGRVCAAVDPCRAVRGHAILRRQTSLGRSSSSTNASSRS